MLAYCAGLGVRHALLVFPGKRERSWAYSLTGAPVRVAIRTLRVVGRRETCERSLRRLARALEALA
jgi:hypothetical protein